MDKYCSAMRDDLENRINIARHELYKLKEERYKLARKHVSVGANNIVLACENYKFAYGDDYKYCNEHRNSDCGCPNQYVSFIGYKAQNGLGYGYYPFFYNSGSEYEGIDRYTMFLTLVARALNFENFRTSI